VFVQGILDNDSARIVDYSALYDGVVRTRLWKEVCFILGIIVASAEKNESARASAVSQRIVWLDSDKQKLNI